MHAQVPAISSFSTADRASSAAFRAAQLAIAIFALVALGCGDDDRDPAGPDAGPNPTGCDVTPGTWSAPDFDANAAEALAVRAQLDTLVGLMRGAEQETMTVDEVSDLTALYEAGTPSIASLVNADVDVIVDDVFADFVALALAGVIDPVDGDNEWDPGASGGIAGDSTRGLNAGGIEVRQIIDKGLFAGGAIYGYAVSLTTGTIDEATIDSIAAAWGTDATLDSENRTDSANYSFDMGYHADIAAQLTAAKAYAADSECNAERDDAIRQVFSLWEESMLARTLYYANQMSTRLAAAATDNDRIEALHQMAEGVGLALGFLGLDDPSTGPLSGGARTITDAQVATIMTALGIDTSDLSASTLGDYISDQPGFQTQVESVEATVKSIYGFTDAEITAFRSPTEG